MYYKKQSQRSEQELENEIGRIGVALLKYEKPLQYGFAAVVGILGTILIINAIFFMPL